MKHLTLKRVTSGHFGTFGILLEQEWPFCVTLEDPWQENQQNISCIPAGSYICERVESPTFGDTFGVKAVMGRSHILFHAGNTIADTEGCILLGRRYGELNDHKAILESRAAMADFLQRRTGEQEFRLLIRWTL